MKNKQQRLSPKSVYVDTSTLRNREESFGHLIRDVHRCFSKTLQDLITKDGITTAQWFFLRVLWDEDGLSQSELSDRVGLTTATTVVALNTLAEKGLVERRKHPSDGRKFVVKLTGRGRAMEQKLRPCGKKVNDHATARIPRAALRNAKAALQQMRANLLKRSATG